MLGMCPYPLLCLLIVFSVSAADADDASGLGSTSSPGVINLDVDSTAAGGYMGAEKGTKVEHIASSLPAGRARRASDQVTRPGNAYQLHAEDSIPLGTSTASPGVISLDLDGMAAGGHARPEKGSEKDVASSLPSGKSEHAGDHVSESREISSGRKFKSVRRILIPLLVALLIKTGILVPLVVGGVSLAALKGLWTGTSALAITAILALRHILPAPRVIMMGGGGAAPVHHHVTDYVADYRRADEYRDGYSTSSYGYRK